LADIQKLVSLAGEHRVADTTIGIPHPYTPAFARMWILTHADSWEKGDALHWAVRGHADEEICGYAGLSRIDWLRSQAELRFWVGAGVSHTRDAVEWATAIISFAFSRLNASRVYALQLLRHHSAGKVLSSVGMRQDGVVRKRLNAGGLSEDAACWSISSRRNIWPLPPVQTPAAPQRYS
jgi:RimJ/RimL family protein N-acetyltransferase